MNEKRPLNDAVFKCSENRATGCYKLFKIRSKSLKQQLLAGLFLMQIGANVESVIRINSAFVELDMLDDSLFVYDDVGALRPLVVFALDVIPLEDAVVLEHFLVHVAEEGKLDVNLLGECCICCGGIHTDAENCRIVGINLTGSESSLDRLKLFGSTTGKSEDVYGEQDVFLAAEVRKLDGLPLVTEQIEIRSLIADFESGFGDLVLVLGMRRSGQRNWECRGQQK